MTTPDDWDRIRSLLAKGKAHLIHANEKHVPLREWNEAEYHFKKALGYFCQGSSAHGRAVATLYLQWLYWDSGQDVNLDVVFEATRYLVDIGEMVGTIGFGLIGELLGEKTLNSITDRWYRDRDDKKAMEERLRSYRSRTAEEGSS